MRRIPALLVFCLLFLGAQSSVKADNYVVPAGTLLRCTLDEPNFSSKTADVGDPVICHLSSLSQFGHNLLPRGSYLGGHLESAKEPGHFWGKGYLKIEFDRIGFPSSDVPVPSKVIAAKGFKVDKKGDILGKGHATRDAIEWLFPPLWPWKVLTLPARGPRPALKGEEQITVRLMDDIEIPRVGAAYHSYDHPYDRPAAYERPPANYHSQSFHKPAPLGAQPAVTQQSYEPAQAVNPPVGSVSEIGYATANVPAVDNLANAMVPAANPPGADGSVAAAEQSPEARMKFLVLKSNQTIGITRYRIDNGSVSYELASGATGSVDASAVDWRATSRANVERTTAAPSKSY